MDTFLFYYFELIDHIRVFYFIKRQIQFFCTTMPLFSEIWLLYNPKTLFLPSKSKRNDQKN